MLSYRGDVSSLLELPPITGMEHLVSLWHEAGTCNVDSAGIGRLSWAEIDAWLSTSHTYSIMDYVEIDDGVFSPQSTDYIDLAQWEVDAVRLLSSEYAAEYNKAIEKGCPPPYQLEQEDFEIDREKVANKVYNVFSSLSTKKEPRYEVEEPK